MHDLKYCYRLQLQQGMGQLLYLKQFSWWQVYIAKQNIKHDDEA